MSQNERISRNLKLHEAIMIELEHEGFDHKNASREALRRLQDKKFKFDNWRDYFTTVEIEGYSLPHKE